ncbi:MAG: hypothetical protein AAF184_19265 [Pseudomonadota bacterium]
MSRNGARTSLSRLLLVSNLSYKLISHIEFIAVALVISIATALAVPGFLLLATHTAVSEVHTLTSIHRAESITYRAVTGRWPAAQAPPSLPSSDPEGTHFDAITTDIDGTLRAWPGADLARRADLGEQSYWLSPVLTSGDPGSPIVWVCSKGEAPPTASALAQRLAEPHPFPPTFCP